MGFFNVLKKLLADEPQSSVVKVETDCLHQSAPTEDYIQVTQEDMAQFTMLPFAFDSEIVFNKESKEQWYMDLSTMNQIAAEDQVEIINEYLRQAHMLCDSIPYGLEIPVGDLVYSKQSEYGYSKLFCSPYTKTGKVSKYPVCLFVTTDLSNRSKNTTCKMYYLRDGSIGKAQAIFWNNRICYIFNFQLIGRTLALAEIKSNNDLPVGMPAEVIYTLEI